jgi:hypothetical protein
MNRGDARGAAVRLYSLAELNAAIAELAAAAQRGSPNQLTIFALNAEF